jgi:hypothetical protein
MIVVVVVISSLVRSDQFLSRTGRQQLDSLLDLDECPMDLEDTMDSLLQSHCKSAHTVIYAQINTHYSFRLKYPFICIVKLLALS